MAAEGTPLTVPIAAGYKAFAKDLRKAENSLDGFGRNSKRVLQGVGVALSAAVVSVGDSVNEFAELDDAVREVGTLLGDISAEGLSELEAEIRDVSKAFGEEGTNAAKAFYDSLSAGVADESNVQDFVEVAGRFAKAGATEMGAGVDILSSSINAFKFDTEEANKISDLFFSTVKSGKTTVDEIAQSFSNYGPAAGAAGLSLEEANSWLAQLTLSGTPTSEAATQIKAALAELSKEGSGISKTFKELAGKTFLQFIDEGGSLEDAMRLIGDEAERSGRSLFDMFASTRAAQGVLGVTGQNAESFGNILDSMADSAGATDQAFSIMSESSGFKLSQMKAAITDVQYTIGSAFLPVLNSLLPAVEPLIAAFGEVALTLVTALAPVFETLITQLLPPLLQLILSLEPLLVALAGVLVVLAEPLSEIAIQLLPVFTTAVGVLAETVEFFTPLLDILSDALSNQAVVMGGAFIAAIWAVNAAFLALSANPIMLTIAGIAALAAGIVYLIQNFDEIKAAISDWGKKIANWIWDAFRENWVLLLGVGGLVYWLFTRFNLGSKLRDFGKTLIQWIWTGFKFTAKGYFYDLPKLIFDTVRQVAGQIIDIGKDLGQWMIEGILDAIRGAAGSIAGAVGDAAGGALGSIPGAGLVKDGIKKLKFWADGGIITQPTLGVAGEDGPEAIIPLDQMGSMGTTYIINISVEGGLATSAEIGEKIEESLQKWTAHKGYLDLRIA